MNFGLPEKVVSAMVRELARRKEIRRAIIFGSRARGDYKYNSDIDIAVYCEGSLPVGLRTDLDEAAGIYKIDVVDMNGSVPEQLRQNIEKDGIEFYQKQ